ncbi:MAG: hypothetical protein ABI588_11820 [Arenimonas sp.]
MSVPVHHIVSERLRRLDGPEFFLGGGFLGGVLVFLVWLAMLPDHGRHSLRPSDRGDAAAGGLASPGQGVLSGITGQSGGAATTAQVDQGSSVFEDGQNGDDAQAQAEANAEAEGGNDADNMAMGTDVGEQAQLEEGAALADGLLGPTPVEGASSASANAPGAPLLPYYVEVEVAPGQVQVLQLNAESPEHARAILRDFRGDPRVLRGPTTEPLQ